MGRPRVAVPSPDAPGPAPEPPGPRYRTPFGLVAELRRDPLAFVTNVFHQWGDVVRFHMGPVTSYIVYHPDALKHLLQDNQQNYLKGSIIAKTKVLIGEGLFSSEGDFWRRQRRLAQPAFHRQRIARFGEVMTEATAALLEEWVPRAGTGAPVDVSADMNRLTLRVVGKALFSMDLAAEAARVGRSLLAALEYLNHRATGFVSLPVAVPTPANLRFLLARRTLDRVVYGIIATRRRTGEDAGDLLAMLLAARDEETGEGMSDRQLRDEVMTFVLAGHETTAVTLSWAFYLLSRHPEVEDRLRAELRTVLGARVPTVQDLPALRYTRMVVDETLRLYPPLWGLSRQSRDEDTVMGYRIRANRPVSMSPYVTHRHPAFWEDPERFDPERFEPARAAGRPRFAYLPFSGGPRQCIGNEFALMEATLVIAMVLQRYRLVLEPGKRVEPEVRITLRPLGGLWMTLERA